MSKLIDVSTKGCSSDVGKLVVPQNTVVPEYLASYLESLDVPDYIGMRFLMNTGAGALAAKIAEVEEYNMTVKAGKIRVPRELDFTDVAIIMMTLYTFRNIQMTERVGDTILAMYVADEDSPKHGIYEVNENYLYSLMDKLAPDFRNRDMDDVLDKIERTVRTVEQTKERHLFIVNNGIYNQKTKELLDFDPEYVYLTKIYVDLKPNPTNPIITAPDGYQWDVDSWMLDIMDDQQDANTLMWQVIADSLQPSVSRHKSVWFYSEKGNNGKGTIGQLIKNLLGKGNYSSLSVADFNHEFLKETLLGVSANISDENDVDVYIDSIKDYKASITGDDININRKYEKPLRVQFHGTNIQMMNGLPKTKDKSDSFYRRLLIVPFMKSFTNNGERKYIKEDYINRQEVLEYVLHKALNIEFEEFITPAISAELMDNYKERNNPVAEFWNELKDEFAWDLLPTQFVYDLFVKWFNINNPSGRVVSRRTFTDTLENVIITQDDNWEVKTGREHNIRTSDKMDADEPLISIFGLDMPERNGRPSKWVNPNYKGDNGIKKREFKRSQMYRGYVRMD